MRNMLSIALLCMAPAVLYAQKTAADAPDIINASIPGAPKLGKPVLIMGGKEPVVSKGHGLAGPAFYDIDGDGNKDLLIGEFASGVENNVYIGNFVRQYRNEGDSIKPVFAAKFDYLRPAYTLPSNGTPLSAAQGCCIGFKPQFIDLDQDGFMDIVTGQYSGHATWFRGTKDGFSAGELLPQAGNPDSTVFKISSDVDTLSQFYWLFSAAYFADMDEDGLTDMVVGGNALRFSKNIGTRSAPRFAQRTLLLDINDQPLVMDTMSDAQKKDYTTFFKNYLPTSGTYMLSPYMVDWDHDGTQDLLVTSAYTHKHERAITFFRGRKTAKGLRFEPGISLFDGKNGAKPLPGRWPHIAITDYNNDGIDDILIGVSVVTLHNEVFSPYLSWNWEHETGVVKYDPGNMKDYPNNTQQSWLDTYLKAKTSMKKIPATDYITARHRGYVYVMLGEKR